MTYHCPKCQRVLYNRRLKNCGFCSSPIPDEMRFTPEEIAALDQQMVELDEQRRQRQLAVDKEKENARQRAGGDIWMHSGLM
jgi:hypothetical protein